MAFSTRFGEWEKAAGHPLALEYGTTAALYSPLLAAEGKTDLEIAASLNISNERHSSWPQSAFSIRSPRVPVTKNLSRRRVRRLKPSDGCFS